MSYYWVTYKTVDQSHTSKTLCVDAASQEDAKALFGPGVEFERVAILPYPTEPRLAPHDKTPSFCYRPRDCAGRTSCPSRPSCTE